MSRHFTFVCNNYTDEHIALLQDIPYSYCVYGKEKAPTTGTPHLQGHLDFKGNKGIVKLRQEMPGFDVRISRCPAKSRLYCKKGEQSHAEWDLHHENGPNYGLNADVTEDGTPPMDQDDKGEAGKAYWENALKKIKEGKEDELDAKLQITHARTIDYIQQKELRKRKYDSLSTLDNHWIWGETGVNKSREVREKYPDAFIKMSNKWWDGYKGEEVVIIEDFDKSHHVLGHHLKIWGDHYPFPAEVKNGTIKIRPKKIFITSNYSPDDIWQDQTTAGPINRRYQVFNKVRQPTITIHQGFTPRIQVDELPN